MPPHSLSSKSGLSQPCPAIPCSLERRRGSGGRGAGTSCLKVGSRFVAGAACTALCSVASSALASPIGEARFAPRRDNLYSMQAVSEFRPVHCLTGC